ncbi:MAG: molybdopterin molybdotransferase MoeA [Ruaniaceae bacterium]|nr:molybdopterin molybdotransferase MoeA [Ruaniaceae bacterium]
MRSVSEHLHECLAAVGQLPPLAVALPDAVGCVLAEDVLAPSDHPIADLADCDGYALAAETSREGSARVMDVVKAGAVEQMRLVPGSVVRIDSGSPMPVGADAVVPLEDTDQGEAVVVIHQGVQAGVNVRKRASEARSGETVLARGTRVGARQIALVAGLGRGRILVHPKPRVVIVSVGAELTEPGRPAAPGQVYDANGHALATCVRDAGGAALRAGAVSDQVGELREVLEDQLVRADLIITTGGLSQGDTVRDVVAAMGDVRFDNVAIAPGRRFGVGHVNDGGTPIFCLPGDPFAVQVAYETFVRPALLTMAGYLELYRPSVRARAVEGWRSPAGEREFVPVVLTGTPAGGYECQPMAADFVGLAVANALAVVPEGAAIVSPGDALDCLILDAR